MYITTLTNRNAANAITSPINAPVIVLRADSIAPLSPPDNTHLIPPQIRNITDNTTATMSRILMTSRTMVELLSSLILHSGESVTSLGQSSIARAIDNWEKAARSPTKKPDTLIKLFTILIVVWKVKLCQVYGNGKPAYSIVIS